MSLPVRQLANAIASSSRSRLSSARCLSSSSHLLEVASEPNKSPLSHRELVEQQRKAFEEKYGAKLKKKAEAEGVRDLESLKEKVMAPSVKRALLAKRSARDYSAKKASVEQSTNPEVTVTATKLQDEGDATRRDQAKGDRAGVKPLASILNLDILRDKTHIADDIAKIWTAHHTTHPTLSASFLSAFLPSSTYKSMLMLAMENPFFVLPLPRETSSGADKGAIKTDEYDMFYLQWLFHPTPVTSVPPSASADGKPTRPPHTSSVIFTPLEEFKNAGEWAHPQLVITHYPELANSHDLVLMRGEISTYAETSPGGSQYLLSQSRAQLLALALQKFYCAGLQQTLESAQSRETRLKRVQTLRDFREKPQEWDWQGLVQMAYGGLL
ncbi:ATP11 protein-domain-containing protein [Kockovaella imperatae]|uniref:ATP11 protein-domain-containing protein n=1 Tax=Kockovaella imperatae TaxID=4999 RepID=A0A1Y1UM77_9TREE|nr:ATP11 protein-domain-containing protein [Kockovaella imperatae]ORX39151.1 ATP11 protein-domain-containing protein [Kockovaella imperatae]